MNQNDIAQGLTSMGLEKGGTQTTTFSDEFIDEYIEPYKY